MPKRSAKGPPLPSPGAKLVTSDQRLWRPLQARTAGALTSPFRSMTPGAPLWAAYSLWTFAHAVPSTWHPPPAFLPSPLQLSSNLTCPSPGGSSAASSRMSALIHRECPLSPNPSRGQAPQPCPACALAVAASSASPTAWPSSKVHFLSCVQRRVGEGRGRGSYTFTESTCYHYSGQVARVRW